MNGADFTRIATFVFCLGETPSRCSTKRNMHKRQTALLHNEIDAAIKLSPMALKKKSFWVHWKQMPSPKGDSSFPMVGMA
jgi:hypothetical protein